MEYMLSEALPIYSGGITALPQTKPELIQIPV
jgi:hypothetical protein